MSWCLQGAVVDRMDGGEDMKRLLQRKLGEELVDRELNKKHDEISGDVFDTGEMVVRSQSRRSSTSNADDGIDGRDAMKKRALSLRQAELRGQELDWEFTETLGQFNISNIVSAIRDMVPSSCLSFASVLCFCNHMLNMMSTCGTNFIDERNKLLRRMPGQGYVRQIGQELGRVPYCEFNYAGIRLQEDNSGDVSDIGEAAHLRCVRTESEACCFCAPKFNLLHQEPTLEVTHLKSNHAEINGGTSPSEGGATADPTDSLVIITQTPGYNNITDAVDQDVVVGTAPPHDVVVEVVILLEVDRGVGEETEDPDGDGDVTDKVEIAKETVDFGDDGNPIILEVLSPAEYTEIVSNICLSLTLVDADYQ